MTKLLSLITGVILCSTSLVLGQVSGTVYQDFNANGALDTGGASYNDAPYAGVTVTAYDASGASVGTATSAANGTYTIPGVSGPLRIEFTYPASAGMLEGASGGTSVQFVTGPATGTNYAVSYAGAYCQDNPYLVSPCFIAGDNSGDDDVFIRWSYDNQGTANLDKTNITEANQMASTWGVAYDNEIEMLYASAVLKRHIAVNEPEGIDAIYLIDPVSSSPNATTWLELEDDLGIATGQGMVPTTATRGLPSNPNFWSWDSDVFELIGKIGLGDIDLSDDNQTLYVMNIFDNTVYAIDVASKTVANSYPLTKPCTNGVFRPWALSFHKGELYAGGVCDASGSGQDPQDVFDYTGQGDLRGAVFKLVGGAMVEQFDFPLDYDKQRAHSGGDCGTATGWYPWTDLEATQCDGGTTAYPTPMFTDIEFDVNDDMIMAFSDRTGYQYAAANRLPFSGDVKSVTQAGDILRACKSGTTWIAEDGGTNSCTNPLNPFSVGGRHEYYGGDWFDSSNPPNVNSSGDGTDHPEVIMGGITFVPGEGHVVSTVIDPVSGAANFATGGVMKLDNVTGERIEGYQLYASGARKGVGLGDLEALCEPAPVEIGNLVWLDNDGDGVQDADDPGIAGIEVELYDPVTMTVIATATTDANGNYIFSTGSGTNSASHQYGLNLTSGNTYEVRIVNAEGGSQQGPVAGMFLTSQDNDASANGEARDSDGTIANTSVVSFTLGEAGNNNHTYDFGFREDGCAAPGAPVLAVANNVCPSTMGSFSVTTPCSATSTIEYSVDAGTTWVAALPAWGNGVVLIARCVDNADDTCMSSNSAPVTGVLDVCPVLCPDPNCVEITIQQN